MKTKIIEAESNVNWGKFLVGIMDDEWERNSAVAGHGTNLLQTLGWTGQHFWMMDLSVGHGAIFSARYFPGDYSQGYREANYAIEKTKIYFCPMMASVLGWFYSKPRGYIAEMTFPDKLVFGGFNPAEWTVIEEVTVVGAEPMAPMHLGRKRTS